MNCTGATTGTLFPWIFPTIGAILGWVWTVLGTACALPGLESDAFTGVPSFSCPIETCIGATLCKATGINVGTMKAFWFGTKPGCSAIDHLSLQNLKSFQIIIELKLNWA